MLLGRDEIVYSLANQGVRRHLVTILGPAGVGKSFVASAIAERTAGRYANGTVLVDLAGIDDERPLEGVLASALGISPAASDLIGSLIAYLSSIELLLVIDNCEHLLGPLAHIVEKIIRSTSTIDMLVTSREPLRCGGEWLYRLPPLPVPTETAPLSVDEAMKSPAVRLFVRSAAKSLGAFALSEANTAAVVGICRQVDGIPLAIQLVAARVRTFSVDELAQAVSRQPLLLARGWRSAHVGHHSSLQAALDWTYTRLTSEEQSVFRRLAVFRGSFSPTAAMEVAGIGIRERAQFPETLLSLAEKSLVSLDSARPRAPYRLLHVTRTYALEKLVAEGELNHLLRSHATHYCSLLSARPLHGAMSREEWMEHYRYALDDVRAALEWAFSELGDPCIAARLTVVSVPMIFQLGLVEEFKRWIKIALGVLARSDSDSLIPQVQLYIALCSLNLNVGCPQEQVLYETAQQAVDVADRAGDEILRVIARMTQIVCHLQAGNPAAAVARLGELGEIVAGASEPLVDVMFDRVSAQAHHYNGDLSRSRTHAERALHFARQPVAAPVVYSAYSIDHRISMRIILARNAWLEGRAQEAVQIASECIEAARAERPFALGQALAYCACPVAFWRGDLASARSYTHELAECARRFGLSASEDFSRCYGLILARLDREDPSLVGRAQPANTLQFDHLATLSDQWLNGATLLRAEQGPPSWCTAEILRRHGEMLLQRSDAEAPEAADRLFRRALAIARAQGALAWEIRICTSLSRLHRQGERGQRAFEELEVAYGNLEGGQDDADAVQVRGILEAGLARMC